MLLPSGRPPFDSCQRGGGHALERPASERLRLVDELELAYRARAAFSPDIEKGTYLTKVNPAEAARAKNCRVRERQSP